MKNLRALLLLFLITAPLFAEGKEKVTISRVKVYLDNEELLSSSDSAISIQTILSFTRIKTDKKFCLKELEKECEQTELRLLNSGLFYTAKVELAPARKNPENRTVIINVTTGFLTRFGGGGVFGVYGKVALCGKRNQLLGFVGWNKNGISYSDENFFNLPVIIETSFFSDGPASILKDDGVNFEEKLSLGSLINPDFRICVDLFFLENSIEGFVKEDFVISPYLFHQHYFSKKIAFQGELRFYYKPIITSSDFSGEASALLRYSVLPKITLDLQTSAGTVLGKNKNNNYLFYHDLSLNHESYSDKTGLKKRCIRSGYKNNELILRDYISGSFEIRYKLFDFVIGNTVPCNIRSFIFTDLAYGNNLTTDLSDSWRFYNAFGAGIQINFDCPVFAYFNFAYGINDSGNGKFCFYTGMNL